MPKVNTEAMHIAVPGMVDSVEQQLGDVTVTKEAWSVDMDFAFAYKGLPGDMCQASHTGYILAGALTVRYADGTEEVFEAGDAYVILPGHVPAITAGTEFVTFTPTAEAATQNEVVMANMQRRMEELGIAVPS